MVVDLSARWRTIPAVHVGRLVAHLRGSGEPSLLCRIYESSWLEPGSSRGPEPQTRSLLQAPGIFERIVIRIIPLSDRAIDLHVGKRHGQMIVSGVYRSSLAVHFDCDARFADRGAQRVAQLLHVNELDANSGAI